MLFRSAGCLRLESNILVAGYSAGQGNRSGALFLILGATPGLAGGLHPVVPPRQQNLRTAVFDRDGGTCEVDSAFRG